MNELDPEYCELQRAIAQHRRERDAEDALPIELPTSGALAMRRHDFVDRLLAEFEVTVHAPDSSSGGEWPAK